MLHFSSHFFSHGSVFKYFELLAKGRGRKKFERSRAWDWIWQNFVFLFHPVRSFGSGSKWRAHLHHFIWRVSLNSRGEPVYPSPLSSLVSAKRRIIAEFRLGWIAPSLDNYPLEKKNIFLLKRNTRFELLFFTNFRALIFT